VPRLGAAIVTVGDPHLTRNRGAIGLGFGTFAVGQFQVGEAAHAQIVDAMHAPVSALTARFGDAAAIGHATIEVEIIGQTGQSMGKVSVWSDAVSCICPGIGTNSSRV
jgi:hypothetical protein